MIKNKYNKPWKVEYKRHWKTNEIEVYCDTGDKIMDKIINCDGKTVVETDLGIYNPDWETAEYIVKCVNERKEE